jgi:hypothetical protein
MKSETTIDFVAHDAFDLIHDVFVFAPLPPSKLVSLNPVGARLS